MFEGRTFDMDTFMNYPKCQRGWIGENGSGCILTAALAAMGLKFGNCVHSRDSDTYTLLDSKTGLRVAIGSRSGYWAEDFSEFFDVGTTDIWHPYDNGEVSLSAERLFSALRKKGMISFPAEFEINGVTCNV
jgi:hypothetical protein